MLIRNLKRHLVISFIILFSSVINGFSSELAIDNFIFMTETYPPFNYEDGGKLQGISVDLFEKMLEKIGSAKTRENIELLPWARAYKDVLTKQDTCLFAMTRTEEREALFKWVGPFAPSRIVLIAPKYKRITINSINDVTKYIVGVVRDDIGEQLLVQAGITKGILSIVHNQNINANKIDAGRIDLWTCGDIISKWILKENGYDPAAYESVYVLKDGSQYFAFNISTDDALIHKLQTALDEIKAEGELQTIMDHYLKLQP
ncbi:ABC transporter substrate-binding protein [Desulfobacterales bacterium HSG17]|nr:ABC transporter substrate-binding protein [Desulfobacterales bacterium HSG17]